MRHSSPPKKQDVAQFTKVPGAFDSDDLNQWRKRLECSGCYPISSDSFTITAIFYDESGEKQVQIKNSANDRFDCVPIAVAYRLFDMSTVFAKSQNKQEEIPSAAFILTQLSHDEDEDDKAEIRSANMCEECEKSFGSKQGLTLHKTLVHKKKTGTDNEVDEEGNLEEFAEPKKTKKRRRIAGENRMRRHSAYTEFMKLRKGHGMSGRKWSDLADDEKKPYEIGAAQKNIADGFDTVN